MSMEDIGDDLVSRVVARAVEVQRRLMVEYMAELMGSLRVETEMMIRAEFGGDRPYIAKGTGARNLARDEAIRKDGAPVSQGGAGMSIRALARRYHLSKSQVANVLAAGPQ